MSMPMSMAVEKKKKKKLKKLERADPVAAIFRQIDVKFLSDASYPMSAVIRCLEANIIKKSLIYFSQCTALRSSVCTTFDRLGESML
ncbi:hypothetical protein HOLleu_23040 [Holothuria leucospilota]|uniref:Uncharacterized protein n=1 Tax=Holothuria leucospilota TaxID=206669 RepID=A0A9Q1BTL1_HOLLE|nr:hypothetical protein HOLleu_23040 [Holothuria leucospilota]